MNGYWAIVKKWLFPGWKVTLPLAAVSAAALYAVFTRGLEGTPLAYAAYLVSFYALVAATGLAVRVCRPAWRWICGIPLVARWRSDEYFRVRLGLILSFLINLCYAGLRVVGAVLYTSFWDGALGFYYILLCAARFYLTRRTPKDQENTDYVRELRTCRWTGAFLLVLNQVLIWISLQIIQDGQSYHYPGTLIYAAAAYFFYALTMAIVNAVKYRKLRSPVLTAAKAVNLTTALVSIFSLETAMLSQFGGSTQFRYLMTSATASAVCVLGHAIAIFLIVLPGRKLKNS